MRAAVARHFAREQRVNQFVLGERVTIRHIGHDARHAYEIRPASFRRRHDRQVQTEPVEHVLHLLHAEVREQPVLELVQSRAGQPGAFRQPGLSQSVRRARLLATLMALQAKLPALDFGGIRGEEKRRYIAAIQAAMTRDYAPIAGIFRAIVARTLRSQTRASRG